MNKFFYPGAEKIDKPGLERHHQLIESSTSNTAIQSQKKVRESLPNNWIYNDNKAKEVWSELEQFESCSRGRFKPEGPNPLQKIDESTAKLRKTITNFEVQDQEFLIELMNLLSEDSFVDSLDQSSILFEARYRLQQMIEEHIDFGERQATLLNNLTNWFTDVKSKEPNEFVSIASFKEAKNSEEKIAELRKLIDDYKTTSNGQIEKAENLHEDMIQNLNEKVNDCQKIISQKDLELTQLNQNLQQANARRKRGVFNVRDSVHYDAELAYSQRRVMELQEQLNTLRTSLTEYTKIKKSNSLREIMIMANLDNRNNDMKENSSLQSERNSVAFTTLNVNDMNFSKLKEQNDGLISVEREIEFESKLCVLANQIRNLKDDNKTLSDQIMQNRQTEILNEKKFQSIERQKKTIESALQSTNKKMENMKDSYERKIKDLQEDLSSGISLNKESSNILELKNNYETKIDKMSEDYRKQILVMQESMDKKYQKQINDVFKSCKNGDTSAALEQVTTHFQQQVLELERHFDKELKNEKRKNAEKLVDLTKHYESLIKKKDKEIERIRNSVDAEVQSRILDVKIEFDDKFNAKSFEDHENAVNEYNEIRRKMQNNIDMLHEKLLKVTRERDTLKSLVDENDLALELMDALNGNDLEEEEERHENNNNDDTLQKSLNSLREKEIEQKVSEKFSLILKAQKENLQEFNDFQLENAKKFFKAMFQQLVGEFREKVVTKTGEISDKLLNENSVDGYQKEIENLLVETVKLSNFDADYELDELFRNPTIPIGELDNKVEKYRNQIIELTSENELWKATFKHIQSHENDGDVSIVDSMKSVIEKQSKRMAEIDKDNRILTDKLRSLPDSKIELLSGLSTSFEIDDLVEFHLYGEYVNDNDKTSNDLKTTKKENKSQSTFTNNNQNKNNSSSNKTAQKQTENKINASSSNVQNVPKGQICCFHCHSNYLPQKVSRQAIKCKLSKCPKCNHLTLMPQTEEISPDQIINDQIPKPATVPKKPDIITSNDIPLPPQPILESVATLTTENGNINMKPKQELPQQFELQLTKEANQQTKEELEKSLQRNQQMKDKLALYEKNFGDLEKQYIKKINKMADDLSIFQKNFINDSLLIVHSTQQLPNENQENLTQKISVSNNISQMLKSIEFPLNATAKTLHQQFIEFTDEKLTQQDVSFEDANEALNLAEAILLYLSNETEKKEKNKKNEDDRNDNDTLTIEKDSIFFCKLNVCKMNIDILKEHNDFISEIVKEILNQMKKMSNKIKQIGKVSINMAQNMKDELKTVAADLNMIIEQRTKAMNDAKKEILNQKTAYDSLQEKFRTSVAAFEQLQISSSSNHDEVLLLKKKEDDQVKTIEKLTNKLLDSQENNRKNEKEIEQLKLRIMELESDQLLLSARLNNQKEMEAENGNVDGVDFKRVNSEENFIGEEEEEGQNEFNFEPVENVQSTLTFPSPLPSIPSLEQTTNNEDEQCCTLEFVPSFVIFSTNEAENGRKKGFSLLPRRLALQQSKPIFTDTSLMNNNNNSQTSSRPQSPHQQETQTNNNNNNVYENPPQNSHKHEKIRVKYVQNSYQTAGFSGTLNARVIVPKSKPKSSISRTSAPNSSVQSSATSSFVANSNSSENTTKITRVLSFENLIPLIENDVVTGSLIGYVTRYVKEMPAGKSLENQAKMKEEKKTILRTSSVLISEVPPEKLRYENNNNNINTKSTSNIEQSGSRSMINLGVKMPLNQSSSSTNLPQNASDNRRMSTVNIERLPKTKAEWIDKLEKKIKSLEAQVRDSSNLLQEERDKSHRSIQSAFKMSVELKQSQRQQKKITLLHDATKRRLEQALEMLSKSDSEIARLKKLLNEVSTIARSIEQKESNEKDNIVFLEDEIHKAFPTKKRVLARSNKLAITTNFEEESKRLLSVFRGVCSGITNMAQKEIESIRKWAPKKDRYINNEKIKLMSALEAMRFITSPDNINNIDTNKKSLKSAVRVQSFEKKLKNEKLKQKRPVSRPVVQKNEIPISYEKATVTANMHNQKLSKALKKGVIGRPATSHSNVV